MAALIYETAANALPLRSPSCDRRALSRDTLTLNPRPYNLLTTSQHDSFSTGTRSCLNRIGPRALKTRGIHHSVDCTSATDRRVQGRRHDDHCLRGRCEICSRPPANPHTPTTTTAGAGQT